MRDDAKDFDTLVAAGNGSPLAIWSDGTTLWVADFDDVKLYAYRLTDGTRDDAKDFDLAADNDSPQGIWSDRTTMWVADLDDGKIYAYTLTDGMRDATKDFDTLVAAGNGDPLAIWSDGTTMWVGDWFDDKVYAYTLSDGVRDDAKDFDTLSAAGNDVPRTVWSDETTLWVADLDDSKLYAYNMPPPSVSVTIAPTTLTVVEGDADGDSYTVQLNSQPSGDVIITISDHNGTDLTLSGSTLSVDDKLTFTADNWDTAQRVKVTAVEDDDAVNDEETISHQVTSSSASEYVDVAIDSVDVTVTDNDATVTIVADAASVTEGREAAFTLSRVGYTDVDLTVTVSVTQVGDFISAAAPTSAIFDANDTTATLVVATEDDSVDEGNGSVTATLQPGSGYVVGADDDATVSIIDDDAAGVTISRETLTVVEGDTTGDSYTVQLNTQPSGDVTVAISGHASTDLTLSGPTLSANKLTFTVDTWSAAQTVTVKAAEDDDATDDTNLTLRHAVSAGSASEYLSVVIASAVVTVTDNDAVVTIAADAAPVSEGAFAAFTLTRVGYTSSALTVDVFVSQEGEYISGTAPTSASFGANDATATLSVATLDDSVDEANGSVTAALQAGTGYVVGTDATATATVSITDNDTAGVTISRETLTVTEGDADGESYTVRLNTQPSGDVTVAISGHASTDLTLSGDTLSADDDLTFTAVNWSAAQTVTVKAEEGATTRSTMRT